MEQELCIAASHLSVRAFRTDASAMRGLAELEIKRAGRDLMRSVTLVTEVRFIRRGKFEALLLILVGAALISLPSPTRARDLDSKVSKTSHWLATRLHVQRTIHTYFIQKSVFEIGPDCSQTL